MNVQLCTYISLLCKWFECVGLPPPRVFNSDYLFLWISQMSLHLQKLNREYFLVRYIVDVIQSRDWSIWENNIANYNQVFDSWYLCPTKIALIQYTRMNAFSHVHIRTYKYSLMCLQSMYLGRPVCKVDDELDCLVRSPAVLVSVVIHHIWGSREMLTADKDTPDATDLLNIPWSGLTLDPSIVYFIRFVWKGSLIS